MKMSKKVVVKDLHTVLSAVHSDTITMPADFFQRLGHSEDENMVSNLPLLFAGGYPTSLDKISGHQLEQFIPFMVQCSLGDIQSPALDSSCEPEWWPEDVPFTIPLRKPANYTDNWINKLKEIVAICYQFHKSVFLLRFCENLSAYQPESLRFIDNYNSTTSLFDRVSNKLLVTFRNENMLYDQPRVNTKKTLMPKMQNSQSGEPQQMVEQSLLFDIYLCDNCEAELYSEEAYQEHEKICQNENMDFDSDDDDVIFCGEQEPSKPEDKINQQNSFLQHFQLCKNIPENEKKPIKVSSPHKRTSLTSSLPLGNNNTIIGNKNNGARSLEVEKLTDKKVRRVQRRAPSVMVLLKSQIPITSPAGQRLIAQSNTTISDEYVRERIERYERFCAAPPLAPDASNRPKFMDKKPIAYTISSFRSNTKHFHCYKFPRRQFSTKARNEAVALLEHIQMQQTKCKPICVSIQRLSHKEIECMKTEVKAKRQRTTSPKHAVIDYIDLSIDSDGESTYDSSESSQDASNSSSITKFKHTVQTTQGLFSFVDCNLPSVPESVELMVEPRNQFTKSQLENVLEKKSKSHPKLFTTTHRSVDLQTIQQDKENRLYSYLSEQSSNTQTTAFIYSEDNLAASRVSTALPSTNLISIDLTL